MKKFLKILGFTLIGIITLILIALIAIRIPSVQKYLVNKALTSLEKSINGDIEIKDINIKFFKGVEITDFSIISPQSDAELKEFKKLHNQDDTLLRIEKLNLSFSLKSLLNDKITLSHLKIKGGVFNLYQEDPKLCNVDKVFPKNENVSSSSPKFDILIENVDIEGFRFTLSNPFKPNPELTEDMIDYSDMRLSNINVKARNANYISNGHDTVKAKLISLTGRDKSGYGVENLSGDVMVTSKQARIENVNLTDGYSVVNADYFSLSYSNAKTLKYFIDSVALGCKFQNSVLDFRTIGKMAPSMRNSTLKLNINGEVKGPVSNLSSEMLSATTISGQTIATLTDVTLKGLPKPGKSYLTANVENATTNGRELASLLSELTGDQTIPFFYQMSPLNTFKYKGEISGTLLDLTPSGTVYNQNGTITFATRVNTTDKKSGLKVNANYSLKNFDAGDFIGTDKIGNVSATGSVYLSGKGKNISVNIDTLNIESVELLDKKITNCSLKGKYANSTFTGKLNCNDPDLSLNFDGVIPINGTGNYSGKVDLRNINLKQLGIDESGDDSRISLKAVADLDITNKGEILGDVRISDAVIFLNDNTYSLGDALVHSEKEDETHKLDFTSDFMKINYSGGNITDFIKKANQLIINENFSNVVKSSQSNNEIPDAAYSLNLYTYNTHAICTLLYDGLYIQNGTNIKLDIDKDNQYKLTLNSGRVAIENNYLRNIAFNADNSNGELAANLFSNDMVIGGFKVNGTRVNLNGSDNIFDIAVNFHNDTTGENQTNLFADVKFERDYIDIGIKESAIKLKGEEWKIRPSEIQIQDSIIFIENLNIVNGSQSFKAHGSLSETIKDSLGVAMENFDVAIVDQFMTKPLGLQGNLSGRGIISMNKANSRMFASFRSESLSIYNKPLGKLQILGRWNTKNKNYDLLLRTYNESDVTCDIRGFYRPEDNYMDIHSTLNDLSVTYFEPLLSSVITNTSGHIKGKIRVFGPTDNLTLLGSDCSFDNFKFTLDYTNVPYTLNGPIEITESGIKLKNNTITDDFKGKAVVSGGVTYNGFKDIKINTRLSLNNLQVLSTTEAENSDFYGDAFASGTVNLTGDLNRLKLNISAQTEPKTFIHIPISKSSNASKTNLLTFIEESEIVEIDPYDTLYTKEKSKSYNPMQIDVNLNVAANENADIWLEVDKNNGDIIKAKGNGNVNIGVSASNGFTLKGNYIITQGNYHFVLMNLTSRDFTIEDGSFVTMNGSPDNIDLDITGIYKTKAAVNYLIADTSGVNTTRMVEANIFIKGKLSEPKITFGIEIPDLDPTTKTKVMTALNTEEKIQKQVAALLVSGGFLPDVESGISQSSSNMLYSNVSAIISSQVGKILNELGIPLDLGINYVPGENNASDAFDVALSTQLFDNRVTVHGNIGNDPYSSYNGRDVIGNIDVDIKLDQKGSVRLNLFSHSTDRYSNDLEESQRNGLGVSYQREFNSFRDIFRRRSPQQKEYEKMFKQRQKEQRAKMKEEKKAARKAAKAAKDKAKAAKNEAKKGATK